MRNRAVNDNQDKAGRRAGRLSGTLAVLLILALIGAAGLSIILFG